jgi:pimeloyl-ACP methyl ester carboxylesterase
MHIAKKTIELGLLLLAVGCHALPDADEDARDLVRDLGPGFASERISLPETPLHYVRGGSGPPLILLHGFPEDWSAWSPILPRLARRFDVIAVDLRGIGGSAPASSGFDAATMARDVHALVRRLELERPVLAGHDVGGIVAHGYALLHPEETRGVIFLDSLAPGVDPWDDMKSDPSMWHVGFLQWERAEELLLGREEVFVRAFTRTWVADPAVITDAEAARYGRAYAGADRLHAALGMYRSFEENERFVASRRAPADVPLVVVGSELGLGGLLPRMEAGFRAHGWQDVTTELVSGSVHYVLDEEPEAVAEILERYASAWQQR